MSEPTTPSPSNGPEHDAWLREALRHAPDASAAPPLSLREAILAEARAAARTGTRAAPAPSFADRFAEFWSWLSRPPVAAGFASVMAATLVGLMWWDRPLDETMPRAPEVTVAARAPTPDADRPTQAPAALAETVTATANAAPQVAPAGAFAPPPTKVAAATDALRDERKDTGPTSSNVATATAAAPAPTPKSQTLPTPFPARDARDSDMPAASRSEPAARAKKAEKNDAQERETREAIVSQNRLAADASATGRLAAEPRPATVARQRTAEVATTTARPMAPLLAALASDGARWSRANAAGSVDAAVQAWLGRVDAATPEWQPLAERLSRTDAARAADAGTLLLYREGSLAAIVEVDDAGVFFEARPGPSWFAPLAPDVVARLRANLPAAAR